MDTKKLTPRQRQVFSYIKNYSKRNNLAPTYEEIGKAIGLSSMATVYSHIKALEKKGYIKRQKGVTRGIDILIEEEEKEVQKQVAILGIITGKGPLQEGGAETEKITIPRDILKNISFDKAYGLQAKGDGLLSECIMDGDFLIFEYTETPRNKTTVLVQLGNIATIRKVFIGENSIHLNSATNPVLNTSVGKANIHGELKAIIRQY